MTAPPARSTEELAALLAKLRDNVSTVFLGKPEVTRLALVALLAEGHLLLEDVPGVGKTLLAKALALSLGCSFHRIQATPDLLPGDLIGTNIFNQKDGTFTFHPGPLMSQIVLADEINRATPRTQSALLEAMSERQVTVDRDTFKLGPPFLVLATQNPYEYEGTYPLPESQLDRFLIRLKIGYPERAAERDILVQHRVGEPVETLGAVLTPTDVVALQHSTRSVTVSEPVTEYLLDIITATRSHPDIKLGSSTRGALAFYRACQSLAKVSGRDHVRPDDVKELAIPVLAHRIMTKAWDQGGRDDATPIIKDILAKTKVRV
ncbi:AAA family ATPase [Limnoglobus roseus]|uniref:MoxR family ATPase n=1 Tax=Limnoglobus roseus TaxID=2598579 RepID=A0A5C1A905_9BACT|nr:MoxR family ATPase [Limnoglobus roseus]QEL15015.1 MoxR family ATPase [Limnoglobus roseus]